MAERDETTDAGGRDDERIKAVLATQRAANAPPCAVPGCPNRAVGTVRGRPVCAEHAGPHR